MTATIARGTAAEIKSYVDRIERLDTEQQTVGLDKKSVYDEAKKAGVNTKMLRRFIAERKRDAKDSQTDKDALEAYRAALGEPGATYRSVAEKLGMTKSKLHRLVPNRGNGTEPPHDPETGEISEIHRGAMPSKDGAEVMRADSSMSESVVASGAAVRDADAMPLDVAAAPHSEGREHVGSAASAPPACPITDNSDGMDIPLYLRRPLQGDGAGR